MLTTAFFLLLQIFGSPSTPILENPEYQTRWYFKYFLGKREYLYVFYQNMDGEPVSRVQKVLDERNSLCTHNNLMRRHSSILNYKSLQADRNKYIRCGGAGWTVCNVRIPSSWVKFVDSTWHTVMHGRGSEGETGEWTGYTVPFTLPRNMLYLALLPLMRTPRLPVVDWTDTPANLNGLVRFAERRNLVSARVPSHFKWPLKLKLRGLIPHANYTDRAAAAGRWS